MVNEAPTGVPKPKPKARRPQRFLAAGTSGGASFTMILPSPKAFSHIFILLSSRTSKEEFFSANGLPREYHGQCL